VNKNYLSIAFLGSTIEHSHKTCAAYMISRIACQMHSTDMVLCAHVEESEVAGRQATIIGATGVAVVQHL